MSDPNYTSESEILEIAEVLRALNDLLANLAYVSIGNVFVFDSNGEVLGTAAEQPGDGFVFVLGEAEDG